MPAQLPLVSVLVPTFNSHATLRATLASIDTRYPCEIIVTDDGSTDPAMSRLFDDLTRIAAHNQADPLYTAEDPNLIVLRNVQNTGGPGQPLQRAAEIAQGQYIIELDGDDLLIPGALDRLIEMLESRPDLDLVWADVECFGEAHHRKAMVPLLDAWHIMHLNGMPCCCLMRRSAHEAAGGWTVGKDGYHDWAMWIALARAGSRGEHAGGSMLRYRVRPDSLFHSGHDKHGSRQTATLAVFDGLRRDRRRAWLRSRAPLSLRLILPVILLAPMPAFKRSRYAKSLVTRLWMRDAQAARDRPSEIPR